MNMNDAKAVLFASMIAVVILPFTIQSADAEKQYARASIAIAFANAEEYIAYDQTGRIGIDMQAMRENGISRQDIQIVEEFAFLNNELLDIILDENSTESNVRNYYDTLKSGSFKPLFDPSARDLRSYTGSYWSLSACGITFGVSAHPHPPSHNGIDGYASLSAIQSALVADGYYQVPWPGADWDAVGFDYAKLNLVGVGGCTDGEFRDQSYIYPPESPHGELEGWHTLEDINEPNSDLTTYVPPTFWWVVYVYGWHHDHY